MKGIYSLPKPHPSSCFIGFAGEETAKTSLSGRTDGRTGARSGAVFAGSDLVAGACCALSFANSLYDNHDAAISITMTKQLAIVSKTTSIAVACSLQSDPLTNDGTPNLWQTD